MSSEETTTLHTCHDHGHCGPKNGKKDWIFLGSLIVVGISYFWHVLGVSTYFHLLGHFNQHIFEVMNSMWWGVGVGILAIGGLNLVPQEMVMTYFGSQNRFVSIFKATLAGTLFDLCSHGILILGMKIYERGATLGQTMAFLIASPWNSLSLTLIMYSLIGGPLTVLFLVLSLVVAFVSGLIFDELVQRNILPGRKQAHVQADMGKIHIHVQWTWSFWWNVFWGGVKESRMIVKWILFGAILSALVSTLMSPEQFVQYFGKSFRGLLATLAAATGLEVCSEGSVPLAADLVNVAKAPGNAFIFLMAGVATDLTEILLIRQTMKSWKVALFLPLITVPQILLLGVLINWDVFESWMPFLDF